MSHWLLISEGHIWTFTDTQFQRLENPKLGCPCAHKEWNYFSLSSVVGSNYFCESGNPSAYNPTEVFLDDPLWDGCI